ncbi:hypothetical protein P615_00950 [Brevibacillus laterosporus PE36]|nr:hypothetical protein P615_00950 [Brevibacillus laterosporus PE36]
MANLLESFDEKMEVLTKKAPATLLAGAYTKRSFYTYPKKSHHKKDT